jgi:hypothetical protein
VQFSTAINEQLSAAIDTVTEDALLSFSDRRIWHLGIACAVAGLHLLVGRTLLLNPPITHLQTPSSFLEIAYLVPPEARKRLSFELPKALVAPIRVSMPRDLVIEADQPPPNSVAITVPSTDQMRPTTPHVEMIVDRTERDSGALSQACARAFPPVARLLVGQNAIVLLARVTEYGAPSETTVVESSGDATRDETVNACVRTHGEFPPSLVDGRPVASWQRIHWVHQRDSLQRNARLRP